MICTKKDPNASFNYQFSRASFCQLFESFGSVLPTNVKRVPPQELHTSDIIFSPLILSPFDGRPYRTACADYSPNTPPSPTIPFPLQRRPHGNAYGGTFDDPEGARASLGTSSSVLKCTWGDRTQSCSAAVDGRTFAIRRRISLDFERGCFHIILIKKSPINKFFVQENWQPCLSPINNT